MPAKQLNSKAIKYPGGKQLEEVFCVLSVVVVDGVQRTAYVFFEPARLVRFVS